MTFSDDAFATPAGAKRMLAYFPNLKVVWKLVRPSQLGIRKLGHFGFFRRAGRDLWPLVRKYALDPAPFDTTSLDRALRGIGVAA
jgi:predicted alpha/beta hydrolase